MSNDIDLSLSIEQIRALPSEKRILYVKYLRILYPRVLEILNELRHCLDMHELSNDPICRLLVGPPGVGKTTLLQIILNENPRTITETGTLVPAFMATIDSPATPGSLASRLLESIGDPLYDKGTISNRMMRAEKFMRDCKTKMLIADEIQHFVDRDSKKILQTVTDALKNIIKKQQLVCILSGLEGEAEKVVDSNPQLSRLFPDPIRLRPFYWDESQPGTIREFRKLLTEVEKILPLRSRSNLMRYDLAWRIFIATDGLMSFLMLLIKESTFLALQIGQEYLDEHIFSEIYIKFMASVRRNVPNPFQDNPPSYGKKERKK